MIIGQQRRFRSAKCLSVTISEGQAFPTPLRSTAENSRWKPDDPEDAGRGTPAALCLIRAMLPTNRFHEFSGCD
jgi:hypothetical protein